MTDLATLFADLDARSDSIPFGNSRLQNQMFVVGAQDGPCRQYRAALLRAQDRRRSLEDAQHQRALEEIDIEEAEHLIASGALSEFDVRRKRLDIAKKRRGRAYTDKLIRDALAELADLYAVILAHPAYTRDEFEALEFDHFASSLNRQIAGVVGAAESLAALGRHDVIGVSTHSLPTRGHATLEAPKCHTP